MGINYYYTGQEPFWFHFSPPEGADMFPVQINSVGHTSTTSRKYHCTPDSFKNKDPQRHYSFQYTLSGSGCFSAKQGDYTQVIEIPAGRAFIYSSDGDFEYWYPGGSIPWEWLWITLKGEFADHVFAEILSRNCILDVADNSPVITCILSLLQTAFSQRITHYDVLRSGCDFMVSLQEAEALSQQTPKDRFLDKAANIINENIMDINVTILGKEFGYSAKYFHDYFRKITGITPGYFIQCQRAEYASKILKSSNIKLSEVARLSGFTDACHLCKIFKQHFFMTPNKWRKKLHGVSTSSNA